MRHSPRNARIRRKLPFICQYHDEDRARAFDGDRADVRKRNATGRIRNGTPPGRFAHGSIDTFGIAITVSVQAEQYGNLLEKKNDFGILLTVFGDRKFSKMKRKDFIRSACALAMTSLADKCILGQDHAPTGILDYDLRQKEIDEVLRQKEIDEVLPDVFTQ